MAFPTGTFINQIQDPAVRAEFEQLYSLFFGYLSQQHLETGAHGNVTAQSVTVIANSETGATGNVIADGVGTFDGNVTADADGSPVKIGNIVGTGVVGFPTTPGIRMTQTPSGSTVADFAIAVDFSSVVKPAMVWYEPPNTAATGPSGFMALYRSSALGTAPSEYKLIPQNSTVLMYLGEDTSGRRWTEVNSLLVRARDGYYEHSRTTALGAAIPVAYTAGDYTCNGGDTWTVQSADKTTFNYALVGDRCFVDLVLDATSITGGTATTLSVKIPGGLTSTYRVGTSCVVFNNTGTAFEHGWAQVEAAGTVINIQRAAGAAFSISANNTYIRVSLNFPVS